MKVPSCCQFGGLIRNQNGFRASVMTSYAWSLVLILYNAPAKSAMYLLRDRYFRFINPLFSFTVPNVFFSKLIRAKLVLHN